MKFALWKDMRHKHSMVSIRGQTDTQRTMHHSDNKTSASSYYSQVTAVSGIYTPLPVPPHIRLYLRRSHPHELEGHKHHESGSRTYGSYRERSIDQDRGNLLHTIRLSDARD